MLVTLLTDFGTTDHFVASMKGVLLQRCPGATLVDITHEVAPQDLRAAAFTLLACYADFPAPAVHLVVVDPGVGSDRRALVVEAGGYRFVAPDNGVLSYVLDREPAARVFHARKEEFFRAPVSTTFHGRDVFAPLAAALAGGLDPARVGPAVRDAVRMEAIGVHREGGGLRGTVLHVDRFGNCITSFTRRELSDAAPRREVRLRVNGHEIRRIRHFFAQGREDDREPFAIWGSAGFLEIAVNRGSAARLLGVRPGDAVLALLP
jgi:S-adenosylmethionine hydrolase